MARPEIFGSMVKKEEPTNNELLLCIFCIFVRSVRLQRKFFIKVTRIYTKLVLIQLLKKS